MTKHGLWKTLRRTLLLDRSPWLKVYADDIELPTGELVQGYIHLQSPGYAMIVPVNESGEMALIRSYKRGVDDIDIQPPAGVLEEEHPLETARRELLEETGCQAESWHPLGNVVLSGNYGGGRAHFFLAVGCRQIQTPDSGDLEEQEVIWLPVNDVYTLYQRGGFQQMGATAALGLAFAKLRQLGLMSDDNITDG
ncbi:MAG: NUDIX hydrolase [Anaerolineales bacterium]|jgi:ADP-ribose pyrophosphatase